MAAMRRVTKSLSSCLYNDFLDDRRVFHDSPEPCQDSCHAARVTTTTSSGATIGCETSVVSPFFNKAVKRGVASQLCYETQWNGMLKTRMTLSSQHHVDVQAHLQASEHVRLTLEAHESETDKAPASFAKIGVDYKTPQAFAGLKIDAVNGPTLQATCGVTMGVSERLDLTSGLDLWISGSLDLWRSRSEDG